MIADFYRAHQRSIAIGAVASAATLTVVYFVLPAIAAAFTVGITWLGSLALIALANWEKTERIGGRLLGLVGWASATAERVALSAEVQGTINGGRRVLEGELADILPYPARVKFVRSETELATLAEGEVVIALRSPRNHAENMARAALAYVNTAAVRPARPYVDERVMRGVDYSLAKRILLAGDRQALDYFLSQLWGRALREDPRLGEVCHELETIEHAGLLTRILLVEFLELGRRLYGQFPPPEVHDETAEFVEHLYRLAAKTQDEDVDLQFNRGHLKVAAVLVADRALAEKRGAGPYVWRCLDNMKRRYHSVYLLARGTNIALVEEVIGKLRGHGRVLDIETSEYFLDGRRHVAAVCVRIVFEQYLGGVGNAHLSEVQAQTTRVSAKSSSGIGGRSSPGSLTLVELPRKVHQPRQRE